MSTIALDFVRSLYENADAAHAFDHVLRVTRLAVHLAKAEGADVEIVRVAALLHDVADSRRDHHLASARMARDLLDDAPATFVDAVVHCIEAHRFSQPPEPATLEAQCLNDADKLDAIGAVGVARAFAFAGARGSRLWAYPLPELDQRIGLDREAYRRAHGGSQDYTPSHELLCKLAGLADSMYTATARQLARERHAFMMAFFRRLDEEAQGLR
ncbi:MAG TPA: HD domain-containing protein [Anaerolineae bacterium]|nr:HD domain-containing protein [Caldilineae bacterium]HID33507.1 HD domain-containing protein [Anaerolineae bacterium]